MIKKLLLIFSFIILATTTFNGTTYAIQTGEIIVITEELTKLNKLYIAGAITEEEFSKAKSILLNPDLDLSKEQKKKKKSVMLKKPKLTAAERRDLKEAEENKIKEEREQMLAEKRAFREASAEEKERLREEKRQACLEDPKAKGCDWSRIKNILKIWK